MTYDNRDRGVLFKNDRKVPGDDPKLPDYTGNINVDGQELWISAWIKTSAKGGKYMSLSVKPKQEAAKPGRTYESRRDFNDEIGF
jgi:hypothetical protein